MKRKVLSVLLASILTLGLTACGGAPATTDAPAPAAEAPAPAAEAPAAEAPAADTAAPAAEAPAADAEAPAAEGSKVYNVAYLVNGNLGDKSFFDSAKAGLDELEKAGRITCTTIEMGGTDEDQPRWASTLDEVSADGSYDLIICGKFDYIVILCREFHYVVCIVFGLAEEFYQLAFQFVYLYGL